jgi:hypothetical protein
MRSGLFLSAIVFFGCSSLQSKPNDVAKLSKQLPDLIAKYRAAGLPWEADDVRQAPADPVDDAGPLLIKASDEMKTVGAKVDTGAIQRLAEEGKAQEAATLLAPEAGAIALAIQASRKTGIDFLGDPDLDFGALPNFVYGTTVKLLCKLLAYKAEIDAKEGHADKAAIDLSAGFRLAALITQEHDIISGLIHIVSNNYLLSAAQSCEAWEFDNLDELKSLQIVLSEVPAKISFADSLRGEAYLQLANCRNLLGLKPGDIAMYDSDDRYSGVRLQKRKPPMMTGVPQEPGQKATMAAFLKVWVAAAPVLATDDPDQITAALDKAVADEDDPKAKSDISGSFEFKEAGHAFMADRASVLATQALNEALIYKSKHGNWPSSIDQLPGKWIDPFSGKHLLMTQRKGGFRVYSVGIDKVDDRGAAKSEVSTEQQSKQTGYDIVAAYPPIRTVN